MATEPIWQVDLNDHVGVMEWSPDSTRIAAGSLAGDSLIVDASNGETIAKLAHHDLGVLAAAWSADGSRLAVGGQDGILRITDAAGVEVATLEPGGWISSLAWSHSSGLLAAGCGRSLVLVDRNGTLVRRYPPAPSTITCLAWSIDGTRVGIGAYGGISWYVPTEEADEPSRVFAWKGSVLSIVLSPNGRWVCAGSQDATVHLWRLWSGEDLSMAGYPAKIEHLAFHDDSGWMANSCQGALTVWTFAGKGPRGTSPAEGQVHDEAIADLAWQPGGDMLVTGSLDGRLALWGIPTAPGQEMRPLSIRDSGRGVARVAWSPDGGLLAIAHRDGGIGVRAGI